MAGPKGTSQGIGKYVVAIQRQQQQQQQGRGRQQQLQLIVTKLKLTNAVNIKRIQQ